MKNETNPPKATGKRPDFIAFHVIDRENAKSRWIEIGAAFTHDDAHGMTLVLDVLPVNFGGRIILRKPERP